MSVPVVGLLTILLGLVSLRCQPYVGFTLFLCTMLLNAAAALMIPGLGSIGPAQVFLCFAGILVLRSPGLFAAATTAFRFPSPGFWLLCLCIYAVLSAFFLPRLFAGQVDINALSAPENAIAYYRIPLRPTNGNITQSVYFAGGVACFAAFYGFASQPGALRMLTVAVLIYGTANIAFALLDLTTSATGVSWLLDFIRNANYVVYVDASVGNVRRIMGSFSEAAAFAYATVGIALFATRLWLSGFHETWAGLVAAVSLALLFLSTSSTAYAALAPCMVIMMGGIILRSLQGNSTRQDATLLVLGPLLALSVVCFLLVDANVRNVIGDYLNDVIFMKSVSASGIERSRLNEEALAAFVATHGFGVGLGTVRPSSFAVAVLANLGVVGALLYSAFFVSMGFGVPRCQSNYGAQVRAAARYGCMGILTAGTVSGTLSDPGFAFFAFAALATTAGSEVPYPRSSSLRINEFVGVPFGEAAQMRVQA